MRKLAVDGINLAGPSGKSESGAPPRFAFSEERRSDSLPWASANGLSDPLPWASANELSDL